MVRHLFFLILLFAAVPARAELRFADLGEFRLESGETIRDCRIAYRTYGTLNSEKSNAVLWPTWFSGTTEELEKFMDRETGWADVDKHFVITVGAIGNGVSSSPSNSATQPGAKFPRFTIADMVRSQRKLIEQEFSIKRLRAVMGISMGGMQTFQWAVMYPDAVERAIPIVGSPRLGAYDLLLWKTELKAIEQAFEAYPDPKRARAAAMSLMADIQELALTSPSRFNAQTKRGELDAILVKKESALIARVDPYDWAGQLRAMIAHDASRKLGGSIEAAARAVRAKMLVIVGRRDHMVTPEAALKFADFAGAERLVLENDCGHGAAGCESERVRRGILAFLQ